MKVEVERHGNQQAVIKVSGRFDAYSADAFKVELQSVTAAGYIRLVVDLAEVPFIDSSGLSALVSVFKVVREQNGTLTLANTGPEVTMALQMTRLNRIFSIYADVPSALASL